MGHVVWTDPAIEDLTEIMDFIARDSPRYALQVGERIYEAAHKLDLGPRAGWVVPEFGLDHFREVLMRPYRIIYEIRGEGCYIVAVIHGSRDLPRHIQPSPKSG
ncbi:MAG: type II toxin-antitoxin system RelE/ParE family toxin [Pirellulaceae bacterium]|nr:type II toxin-antitoxin system RelE/ParE family toxin [Pirellulaceae bacterium]